jgi:hypothetical protein
VRPEKQKPQWGFCPVERPRNAGRGRSLKLAAFAAFAGPLDLLTPLATQLTDTRIREKVHWTISFACGEPLLTP